MDSVIRAAVVYLFLFVLFRASGKRSLAQITTFDFILLLIIGEAAESALLGEDASITNAAIVISTLVGIDVSLSKFQARFRFLGLLIDDAPLVIVQDGRLMERRTRQSRVTKEDVLQAARTTQGLERMDQIKYAVLERTGEISIIPRRDTTDATPE